MATYAAMKPTKPGLEESQEQIHKIRITLSSKHVKNLEKGMPQLIVVFVFKVFALLRLMSRFLCYF